MNKILEQALEDYKKANQKARIKILAKYDCASENEFYELCGVKGNELEGTDMVVAFDTTGSMSAYINDVKKHVDTLIPNMFENIPNLKMKIVAFGDYCDMPKKGVFGNAYQESEFTESQIKLKEFVKQARDTSGGDTDEFYELVIKKVTEETPWRKNTKKVLLLIADYGPHEIGYTCQPFIVNNQIDWKQEAHKAKAEGIQIDTLRIRKDQIWYKELSEITGGSCVDFQSSDKTADLMKFSGLTRGATYSVVSEDEAGVMYRRAKERGDDELVGAMKEMAKTSKIDLDKK